jgi:NTE family protein
VPLEIYPRGQVPFVAFGTASWAPWLGMQYDPPLYWDGGILSNSPTEVIFEDNARHTSLIFSVHVWNQSGPEPETIWQVLHRQKDIQYSSRIAGQIAHLKQTHQLRLVITELARLLPEDVRASEAAKELANYGCVTRMHVVRLLAPRLDNENFIKDVDFSRSGIRKRWLLRYPARARSSRVARRIRSPCGCDLA